MDDLSQNKITPEEAVILCENQIEKCKQTNENSDTLIPEIKSIDIGAWQSEALTAMVQNQSNHDITSVLASISTISHTPQAAAGHQEESNRTHKIKVEQLLFDQNKTGLFLKLL